MLEELDEKELKWLKDYFDIYCNIIYNKTYPLTINNLKIFLEESIIHHFNSKEIGEINQLTWNNNPKKLECYVNYSITGKLNVLFIQEYDSSVWNKSLLTNYILFLKKLKKVSRNNVNNKD